MLPLAMPTATHFTVKMSCGPASSILHPYSILHTDVDNF